MQSETTLKSFSYLIPDIDECSPSNKKCHSDAYASCTNSIGSFTCSCNRGYTGNGTFCQGKLVFSLSKCNV